MKEAPRCLVCQTVSGDYRHQIISNDHYSIIKCANCGLEYTDPIPSEEELEAFYFHYKDIRAERKIVELNAKEHLKVLAKYGWTPESKTLDFGTGEGVFCEVAGHSTYGVELKPSNNLRIRASLEDAFIKECKWDFITIFGVLEHLRKPTQIISQLVQLMNKGGVVACTTVNAEGLIPYYYKPPEHLSYWTRKSFEVLCDACGLEIVEYGPYQMFQLGSVYFERLLSRTPMEYHQLIISKLPEILSVPTNEVFVLMRMKR